MLLLTPPPNRRDVAVGTVVVRVGVVSVGKRLVVGRKLVVGRTLVVVPNKLESKRLEVLVLVVGRRVVVGKRLVAGKRLVVGKTLVVGKREDSNSEVVLTPGVPSKTELLRVGGGGINGIG